ncbi:MAG TPA: hypothetical protein VHV77_13405 [Pirellulales bacterium]|jgi:hypothetical protein|nr:hypothetical protein [Pirellulales bacterium]
MAATHDKAEEKPIRVGVFSSASEADATIHDLLAAGFSKEEITVVCGAGMDHDKFREFEHQEPAGTFAPSAAAAGGVLGAALGGLTVIAGAVTTGGIGLLAAGGLSVWGGGVVGGLVGAMMTRGVEKELADFYDQAVTKGKILVAVEEHGATASGRLARASQILAKHGAEPLPLREG